MCKRSRDWNLIKEGDIVKAKKHVLALSGPGTQFLKGEKVKVVKVTEKLVGLLDKFSDIAYFKRDASSHDDFIGDLFE